MVIARPQSVRPGVVSIVTINYRGATDTITCLHSLQALTWPAGRLEVICVENASGDDSAAQIRAAAPDVQLIESQVNTGFAGGCNLAVAHATGEYIAFLNNDARPDPAWLSAAVQVLEGDPQIGCVASKVLDWSGEIIDYVDGSLAWYGMGYKRECAKKDHGEWDQAKDVLFPTGAAMVVRAELFREVGGFDERFFMFFEDVDLGWRLNLLGHRVRYVPTSVAYHRHHSSMDKFGAWRERYLLERNALLCIYKNLEDSTLTRVLAPAIALTVRRSIALGGDDPAILDLQRAPGGEDTDRVSVAKTTLTGPYAIDHLVELLPSLDATRHELRGKRQRSDLDLLPLFRRPMEPILGDPRYQAGYDALVSAFDIAEVFADRRSPVPSAHLEQAIGEIDPGRLLQDYRESAAHRAERVTKLHNSLHAANLREAKTKQRLTKAQTKISAQQTRLTQLQERLVRLQAKIDRLERRGESSPPNRQPTTRVRKQAGLLARQLVRRLGPAVAARRPETKS